MKPERNPAQSMVSRAEWVRIHAEDERWDVPSPCISVCRMDPQRQQCLGCFRTLDEIATWSQLNRAGKRTVWQRLAQRAKSEQQVAP